MTPITSREDSRNNSDRTARRQRLVRHLCQCGERPVLEALVAVAAGQSLDHVLDDFFRLPPALYRAVGADVLAIDNLVMIDGGRA